MTVWHFQQMLHVLFSIFHFAVNHSTAILYAVAYLLSYAVSLF